MGRKIPQDDLRNHKTESLQKLNLYLDSLIDNADPKIQSKADKLSYWIKDWTTFLKFEPNFHSDSLRRYKRGEIIKVHLGYNIGSEEGGLHYCVVLDKNNSIHSPVITVVPLTSVKPKTDLEHLKKGNVYLGNELFTSLSSKISANRRALNSHIDNIQQRIDGFDSNTDISYELEILHKDLIIAKKEQTLLQRMTNEIGKMRMGSIALVGQITTISKIRIYDPKTNHDILSNVKLSNEKLDLIDQEIIQNFTGKK